MTKSLSEKSLKSGITIIQPPHPNPLPRGEGVNRSDCTGIGVMLTFQTTLQALTKQRPPIVMTTFQIGTKYRQWELPGYCTKIETKGVLFMIYRERSNYDCLKVSLSCLIMGLVCLFTINLALSQNTSAATLKMASGRAEAGSEITLPVTLTAGADEHPAGVSFFLNYDPAVISGVKLTIGSAMTEVGKTLNTTLIKPGSIAILVVNFLEPSTEIHDGTVVEITFSIAPDASGTTPVTIDNCAISKQTAEVTLKMGEMLPVINVNGVIAVGFETQMSADKDCLPKDAFDTRRAASLEEVWVAGTLPVPAGEYTVYLTGDKNQWMNGDLLSLTGFAASTLINIDSNGQFCGFLWRPAVGDNNNYDIILDVNGNGYFDPDTDFLDSGLMVGARTLIELASFDADATAQSGKIVISWTTLSEIDNAGFNILRSEAEDGKYTRINPTIIEAVGGATEWAVYSFTDDTAQRGVRYYYQLEDIDYNGVSTFHGPVSAMIMP
jgi:hypothetical protein